MQNQQGPRGSSHLLHRPWHLFVRLFFPTRNSLIHSIHSYLPRCTGFTCGSTRLILEFANRAIFADLISLSCCKLPFCAGSAGSLTSLLLERSRIALNALGSTNHIAECTWVAERTDRVFGRIAIGLRLNCCTNAVWICGSSHLFYKMTWLTDSTACVGDCG